MALSFSVWTSVELILSVAVVLSTLLTVILLTLPSQYRPRSPTTTPSSKEWPGEQLGAQEAIAGRLHGRPTRDVSVQVVVLGDIGRSPRMQYHALSIARHGGRVEVIGYRESDMHPRMNDNPLINIVPMAPVPQQLQTSSRLLFLLLAPFKVLWQVWSLYYALSYRATPAKWMLVQNPPSIPTLLITQIVCFLRNTRLVIDWHNFGYSILALKLGPGHFFVRISELYESAFSQSATAHITVSDVMARTLKEKYGIRAATLHDRPPEHFRPLSVDQRYTFLAQLPQTRPHIQELRNGSRKLIVSSTSWTADEDFSILLDALVAYSTKVTSNAKLPSIVAIITGKGPQKHYYESEIQSLNRVGKLAHVEILTAWLSAEDYAALLGAADLGVSLHTSSSGVDLPMKVVDMFGTGLPVIGWSRFEAWPELVKERVNGRGFGSADELFDLLIELFGGDGEGLKTLRDGALHECKRRWDDEWDPVAGRLFGLI